MVGLHQAEALRVGIGEGIELQGGRVVQRAADPLAVTAPHGQAVGVVDLRVNGVAHPALVGAATEHAGHRRDAQLVDGGACVDVGIDLHHHALGLAVDIEAVGTGGARRVEQGVDHEAGAVLVRCLEPELGEVGKFFAFLGVGVDRQAAGRQTVLAGGVYRTEVTGAEEGHDIVLVQFRGLEQLEAGETQVALELCGVDRGVFIVEQRRAEMHLAGHPGFRIDAVHAHRLLEPHADVEELHVQLPLVFFPQRMIAVVANRIEVLRGHGRQGRRQLLLGVLVAIAGELFGLELQRLEIERGGLAISGATAGGPGLGGQQARGGQTGVGRDGHGGFEQVPAVHKYNLS
ncbi:hypothetical protein D3C80_1180530 [compost metagenome]